VKVRGAQAAAVTRRAATQTKFNVTARRATLLILLGLVGVAAFLQGFFSVGFLKVFAQLSIRSIEPLVFLA
jgi:hypothetical protein